MGMAASQARLLALQSRENTQEAENFVANAQKTSLARQQKELSRAYHETIQQQKAPEIKDEACISSKAMALYKADNNQAAQASNTAKATGIQARALNAYRCFAS